MTSRTRSDTPLLDEWIAEAGEQHVVGVIEDMKLRIADGSLPAFDDKAALMQHWNEGLARRDG